MLSISNIFNFAVPDMEMAKYDPIKHFWIYALELEDNKFYIGITARRDPRIRLAEHGTRYGARWTKKHNPVKLLKLKSIGYMHESEAKAEEQQLTLRYMQKRGLNKVRGGSLTYPGKYVAIGDRFWRGKDFAELIGVIYMLIVLLMYIIGAL